MMEIGSNHSGVGGRLSNFTPRPFVFDNVECNSMEGLLQSFKFDKEHIQIEVCKLTGLYAKQRGQKRNKAWKSKQTLWWKGVSYKRDSDEYQDLLERAFTALSKNNNFARDLLSTNDCTFSHSIGRNKIQETVLTEREFCSLLSKTREKLKRELTSNKTKLDCIKFASPATECTQTMPCSGCRYFFTER